MKNKLVSAILVFLSSVSLIACGASTSVPDSSDVQTVTSESSASEDEDIQLYDHISNEEYLDMLNEYNEIFTDAMSIVSTNQVAALISEDATIEEVVSEIDRTLEVIDVSSAELQEYFDSFDKNRSEAPMQTRIMTLLSDAQSALTQYKMAMEDLKWYSTSPDQEYMDSFLEYSQKAQDSIENYNSVLNEELSKLGEY